MRAILLGSILLLAGCIAPPAAHENELPHPAALAGPAPRVVDETLRVSWTPERPVAGDVLHIHIDAPLRWPEPRCDMTDVIGQVISFHQGGGSSESVPAQEADGGYVCTHTVAQNAAAVAFSVTRHDADGARLRIHGPHVLRVDPMPGAQQRAEFVAFELDEDDAGLPRVRAELPPTLARAHVPGAIVFPEWNVTRSMLAIHVVTVREGMFKDGGGMDLGTYHAPAWTGPTTFDTTIDAPQLLREATDHRVSSDPYVLLTYAIVDNEHAFAVSEPRVRGFGACADGGCYVIDSGGRPLSR